MALNPTPFMDIVSPSDWTNFHGTLPRKLIPHYCIPKQSPDDWKPLADSVRTVMRHCFEQRLPMRTIGRTWSLSNIIRAESVIFDPKHLDHIAKVNPNWLTNDYRTQRLANGFTPFVVQGGAGIGFINSELGKLGYALQTSGASNGHLIAGCIATGTHGSAIDVGAVHDTILAVHLIVSPDRAKFIQAEGGPCTKDVADWLESTTGIPTDFVEDDDLFRASLVSLGSLGFVHAVVFEATKLYRLRRTVLPMRIDDPRLTAAIDNVDEIAGLHPGVDEAPHHFEVVFHPYPRGTNRDAYAVLMWKEDPGGALFEGPSIVTPDASSDLIDFIDHMVRIVDCSVLSLLSTAVIAAEIASQLEDRYPLGSDPLFPGTMFGPTSTPGGKGISTEIVVDQKDAVKTLEVLREVFADQSSKGRHLLGAIGVRFVPASYGLLAMNQAGMSCFIEMPGFRSDDVKVIYAACFDALEAAGITFTCHWGQLHGLTPERVEAYFEDKMFRWKAAREKLLDATGRVVFGGPFLAEVGLAG